MKTIIFIIALLFPVLLLSQDGKRLSHEAFMEIVMTHHPMVYRADLLSAQGEAKVLSSKGAFDPKAFSEMGQKYFKGTQYYSTMSSGIKIPTWFGISVEGGYETNQGKYLDPQRTVPDAGLWYAGLRLDLGNGLIMNQRRAEFEKARIYRNQTELERTILKNQLYNDASNAYWKWYFAFKKTEIYAKGLNNAQERFTGIKEAAFFGDKPFIDTVEANIVVLQREQALIEAQTALLNTEAQMELYLWSEGVIPIELDGIQPASENIALSAAGHLLSTELAVDDHPYLRLNTTKLNMNTIDLKLKREQFKPDLTLKYSALSQPVGNNPLAEYSIANYNWGLSFAYPLLSRKARGEVRMAKLKIQDQEYQLNYVSAELQYKIKVAQNNLRMAAETYRINNKMVESSEKLYQSEQTLFNLGESSVFMINSRESSYLKSAIQYLDSGLDLMIYQNALLLIRMKFDV